MTKYVALLRGINVGGNRVIVMAELRDMFAVAGARDVITYIQSGNVVFAHAARSVPKLAAQLAGQIANATGFEVPVMLRTAAEWEAVVRANPFAGADTDQLHVSFLATAPDAGVLDRFDAAAHAPERFALVGRELYMHLPDGMGRSKLVGALGKVKPIAAGTARNWRTVLKLHELVS